MLLYGVKIIKFDQNIILIICTSIFLEDIIVYWFIRNDDKSGLAKRNGADHVINIKIKKNQRI
jgi:hypothetical protein